jgi:hypothetical protein
MKNLLSLMGMLTLAGSFMLPSHVMAADKTQVDKLPTLAEGMIGEVTFLLGRAEVTLPDGTVLPLAKDMEIPDGSRVLVKERSILRLTLADGGREKLGMPEGDTVFIFNKYAYDPANPQATQIRKTIVDGEVTSKTGEGGEKAKDRYRLNTPLAAIAILGTEYTVRVVQGQTWVTVNSGEISIAKLGGSCQASGLGACVGGERLSENQRGLALVVRSDQPKPVFVPVTAVPGAKNTATSNQSAPDDAEESSEDAAESDEKTSTEKTADKSADKTADKASEKSSSEKTADKQADADKGEVKSTATTEKTADKATDKTAATEKTTDKASPVTTEKTADKTASTATASDKTTKTVVTPTAVVVAKVDERDLLAVESPVKTTTVEEKKQETVTPVAAPVTDTKKTTATPVANVAAPASSSTTASVAPTSVGSSSSTGSTALVSNSSAGSTAGTATLESKQTDSSTTTSVLESKQPSATSTPAVSSSSGLVSNSTSTPSAAVLAATPVLESTKPTLLVSPGSDPISGSVVTTSTVTPVEVATPLVSSSDGLVETSKTEATLTTDAGEVVAAVTPAPAEPVAPATPATPAVDPSTQPVVRWGKYDPTATADASTTQGDQVSSLYEQLLQTALGGYVTERQKTALAVLPEQRDVTFALGSYEANVNNAATGVKTSATIGDARLSVSSTRNTYDTGFTLTSSAYTGSITSTGTFSSTDGTLKDDGTNPQTRLSGAVGVMGESVGAAYIFTHQIDPLLSAEGALNWTGTLVPASTASAVPVSPTTATVAVAPVAGTAIAD